MSKKLVLTLAAALGLIAFTAPAQAQPKTATITLTKPLKSDKVKVTVTVGGVSQVTEADIDENDSAEAKRKKVAKALRDKGYHVQESSGDRTGQQVTIYDLAKSAEVTFDPGMTGEDKDQVTSREVKSAKISFNGLYSTLGLDGKVAAFTAGVIGDGGQAVIEYRPVDAEPGDEIAGSDVARALFESLSKAGADLGVDLYLDDATLYVVFAKESHETEAGVVFGTTSDGGGEP